MDSSQLNVSTIAFFNMGLLSSRPSDPLAFGRTHLVTSSLEFDFLSSIFLAASYFFEWGFAWDLELRRLGWAEKPPGLR